MERYSRIDVAENVAEGVRTMSIHFGVCDACDRVHKKLIDGWLPACDAFPNGWPLGWTKKENKLDDPCNNGIGFQAGSDFMGEFIFREQWPKIRKEFSPADRPPLKVSVANKNRKFSIEHKALLTYIEAFRHKLQEPEDVYVRGAEVGANRVCIAIGAASIEKMHRIRRFYMYHDKKVKISLGDRITFGKRKR